MRSRLAFVVALALLAAACTGSDTTVTTAGAADPPSTAGIPTTPISPTTKAPLAPATTVLAPLIDPPLTLPPTIEPDPDFVLRYATPGPVDMRSNPFAPADTGQFPKVFAAHLYRVLPPTFTLIPELAADDEPPPTAFDGTGWVATVTLNEGLTWSDGDPIDAFDVQFTFEDLVRFGHPADLGWVVEDPYGTADLVSVTALDGETVEFRFSGHPTIDRWHFGIATASILPEHYWGFTFSTLAEGNEQNADLGLDAPSAGAYRFGSVASDDEWRWEAVDGWWNSGAEYTVFDGGSVAYRNRALGIEETYGGEPGEPALASWIEGPYAGEVAWFDAAGRGGAPLAVKEERADLAIGGFQFGGHFSTGDAAFSINRSASLNLVVYDPTHPALATSALRSALPCFIFIDFLTTNVLQGTSIPSGWVPHEGTMWSAPTLDDPCDVIREQRVSEGIRRMTEVGWMWEIPPTSDGASSIDGATGLDHVDGLSKRLTILAPPPSFSPLAATTGLWMEGWLIAVGFNARVKTGFAGDPEAPDWDIAIVIDEVSIPPRPYISTPDLYDLAHLASRTVSEAAASWEAVRQAFAGEALAAPLFTPHRLDLYSPDLHFPYTNVVNGFDAALVASAVRPSPYGGTLDCEAGSTFALFPHIPPNGTGHRTPQDAVAEVLSGVQRGWGGIITATGSFTASLVIGGREIVVARAEDSGGRGWFVTRFSGCAGFRPTS